MTRTDSATKLVKATPAAIYRALVDPKARVAWLPPRGMTARFEAFDARVGGSYRMVLSYDDATGSPGKTSAGTDVVEARFVDLSPDRRVVEAVDFVSDDPSLAGTMTMTWALAEVPGGTYVSVTATGVPDGVGREDHAAGLRSSLDNLAAYLE